MKWNCLGCTLTKRPGLEVCSRCCGWKLPREHAVSPDSPITYKEAKVPSGFFVCELCRQDGHDVRMPNDPIGAALMQQHLNIEHDVTLLTEWGVG